jgi:hypothetical protein
MAAIAAATDATPKDLVARLYHAHCSKHDPLVETKLLDRYFDAPLLKLYLRDKQEAKGEVGRTRWGSALQCARHRDFALLHCRTRNCEGRSAGYSALQKHG